MREFIIVVESPWCVLETDNGFIVGEEDCVPGHVLFTRVVDSP